MLLLAFALPFLASCSDDDMNSAPCTVGFESSTVEISEASIGYVNIPIAVSGRRNGPVHVTIESAPTGNNPAIEGEHYYITDKTLNINADTLSTGQMNVEIRIVNDDEINESRQFTLTITSVDGAEVSTQTTTVSIADDDSDTYMGFFGTWYLNATTIVDNAGNTGKVSIPVTISGATSKDDADYERRLTLESSSILSGLPISFTLDFNYDNSDPANLNGTIGIPMGQTVVTDVQTADPVTGEAMTVNVLLAGVMQGYVDMTSTFVSDTWTIGSDGTLPTAITFQPNIEILFGFNYNNPSYPNYSGFYNYGDYFEMSLTREPLN